MEAICECGHTTPTPSGRHNQRVRCVRCGRAARVGASRGDVIGSFDYGWYEWRGDDWVMVAPHGTHYRRRCG